MIKTAYLYLALFLLLFASANAQTALVPEVRGGSASVLPEYQERNMRDREVGSNLSEIEE
ncbi:hypothetical protein [Tunicatimonas pelagia]|uniref:hypothetical protein n=1 Tax=Tunicatimonas pelagia TaxID=931531 RepID=UPI00266531E1|nr:hypothetical protein [Tunicatimonas pelagia]WKN43857.1 hypothetical protein P0M28_02585 [Tunicatimonas pelagia]